MSFDWKNAKEIWFASRPYNIPKFRRVWDQETGESIGLIPLFEKLGISPNQLKSLFKTDQRVFSFSQLGYMPTTEKNFQRLATIVGKTIHVHREDGATGEVGNTELFTAYPS